MSELFWELKKSVFTNSEEIFKALEKEVFWEQREITLFGKTYMQPRLIPWQGEKAYSYSKQTLPSRPFTKVVSTLIDELNSIHKSEFNGALLNLYRNGNDSMGWHSDNESELGKEPLVFSLSFGAERRFRIREKNNKKETQSIDLPNNSLLIMKRGFQERYEHCLPKTSKNLTHRINLTFRKLI